MTAAIYIDDDYVKSVGSMPSDDVDFLRTNESAFLDGVYKAVTRLFDVKLAKRYVTPLGLDANGAFDVSRVPESVRLMCADVALLRMWRKRGFNPGSQQDENAIIKAHDDAMQWLNEAADAEKGFVELPRLTTTPDGELIAKGAPMSYSEQSPYTFTDRQADEGRREDRNRTGSRR